MKRNVGSKKDCLGLFALTKTLKKDLLEGLKSLENDIVHE